jgi:hypothetical protein
MGVCAGCIERGYAMLDPGAVKIVPISKLREIVHSLE